MSKYSLKDKITNTITFSSTIIFFVFVIGLLISLIWHSRSSIQKFGFSFVTNNIWNVKFLELSHTQIKNESFELLFTNPLKSDIKYNELISLYLYGQKITFTSTSYKSYIYITPSQITNGLYSIKISSNLLDTHHKKLKEDVSWFGFVDFTQKKISNQKIIGTKSGLITSVIQDENERNFGLLAFIIGTVLSSVLALLLSFPIALAVALFLTEYSRQYPRISHIFSILIDLLAGIPSVVYGLWGLFYIVPKLGATLGTASVILAIMTIPYAVSLSKEAILLVPKKLSEVSYALGASKYKTITKIILPYAQSGIIASILLSLGRALGETLAVTMVIGNRNQIPTGIFQPAQTIASLIANEYGEASGLKQSALIEGGLVLIIITLLFSLLGRFIIKYTNRSKV